MMTYKRLSPALLYYVGFFLSVVSRTEAQAPGDGYPICTEEVVNGMMSPYFATRPVYSPNERPLMDSRDYIGLLQGGDNFPWQTVDNDDNNRAGVATSWFQPRLLPCNGSVIVCGFSEGLQENWLLTQHINTVLPGGEGLRKVTAQFEGTINGCDISRQCRQSFEVHKWLTSTIDRSAATNTDNYVRVDRVSPEFTSGVMPFVEYLDIGLYLAVVDRSTCIVLTRLLVFYYVCPEETSELISRPETLGSQVSVTGECVENSSTMSGTAPFLSCSERGEWQVIISCLCNPGYKRNEDQCTECPEGTFSAGVSNGPCETCPANSEGTGNGLTLCPCLQDYYRAPTEEPSVTCTRSPGAPSNITVSNVTNTSVVLSWSPPVNGGGRPLSEIFYTRTAIDTDGRGGVRVELGGVNGTETSVTGLTPGVYYTFSVTAENAVSSQDNNINARTVRATANTEEGVGGTVSEFMVGEDGVLSWSPPVPPNGVILHYNVIITRSDTGELVRRVDVFEDQRIDLTVYGAEIGMDYNVTVQAVTAVGGGSFSSPVTVSLRQSSEDSGPPVVVITLAVIVVLLVILSLTSVSISTYFCWKKCSHRPKDKVVAASDTLPEVVYEVPDVVPLSGQQPLHLKDNKAYGMVPTAQYELADNVSYGVVNQ